MAVTTQCGKTIAFTCVVRRSTTSSTVTIKVRYADFTTLTRSHTAEPATDDPSQFAARALALLGRTEAASRSVRLLGVGAHGIVEEKQGEDR